MSHLDDVPAEQDRAPSKPDFMVWPVIPDAPRTPTSPRTPATGIPGQHRRRRLAVRLLILTLIVGVVVTGAGFSGFLLYERHLESNVDRIGNPFKALPEGRPKAAPRGAANILMLGSDSRISAEPGEWVTGAQRTDAIMIAHIPADRSQVTVTSIPRDSRVSIPGHGKDRINAAYGFGGPTLMVQTVEDLTGVRMDHFVIVDFKGFKDITDELDGVRINVAKATSDADFPAGARTMDGATALRYIRQREDLPGGDFDRVKRQQKWLRAVALETLDKGMLTSPLTLNNVLDSLTSSIAADDDFTIGRMRSLAMSLRGTRGDDLTFLTAPVAKISQGRGDEHPIITLDDEANRTLWQATADDTMGTWLDTHRVQTGAPTGAVPSD